jgi:DNA primase
MHSPEARAYLRGRGLESRMLKRFNIGYAPAQWRGLREAFADYDRNTTIVEVGLVREKHQGEEHAGEKHQAQGVQADASKEDRPEGNRSRVNRYDTFRDRITFGVRDTRGRIVAFGGRLLDGGKPKEEASAEPSGQPGKDSGNEPGNQAKDGPKYLNSPESPIFDKSGSLFGLFEARESIRQHKRALVVEGFMDVVMLAQHGVENAVAAMGTAFTRWHLERLLTQTSNIAFCFDGDAAGQRAAFKAMETCAGLIEDEHDFRFVILPDNLDPDEFVRSRGAQAMQDLVQSAPGWTEFMLTSLQERHGIDPSRPGAASAQARAQFAAQAVGLVQRIAHGQRLRKIALEQIDAESRLPGTALQTLRRGPPQAAPTRARTLWELLQHSAKVAPAVALSVREEIIELLEPEHPQELALLQALQRIESHSPSTAEPSAAAEQPGNTGYLMACDSLKNAVDLIVEHRQRQVREELDRQLAAGQITDLEYLRAKQNLMDEAGASCD